jgi:hypothetical protein
MKVAQVDCLRYAWSCGESKTISTKWAFALLAFQACNKGNEMLVNKSLLIALAAASLALGVQPAGAQAPRTWVSGLGDDANPCSRTAPCKTFAGAISKTAASGEISVLDPSGYGAVTITKSITIDGGGGQVASVLVSGTNGIVVSAGAGTVTLRNLRINGVAGAPSAGLNGVQILSAGAVHIENCTIFGFTQSGININVNAASPPRVFVTDTVVSNSVGGIAARNAGVGGVSLVLYRTTLAQNSGFGLKADGGGGTGLIAISASDSFITGNGTGVSATGGPSGSSRVAIVRSSIVNNATTGAVSDASAGKPAEIIFSNSLIFGNPTGVSSAGGGTLFTYKNNNLDGNANNGTFNSTLVPE